MMELPFTDADRLAFRKSLERQRKRLRKAWIVIGCLWAIIQLSWLDTFQTAILTHVFVLIITVIFMTLISLGNHKFFQDHAAQIKVAGTFEIVDNNYSEDDYFLVIKAPKRLQLNTNRHIYDRIKKGDHLYIEFTKHANELLAIRTPTETLYPLEAETHNRT